MVHQDGEFPWPPSSCSFPQREGQGVGPGGTGRIWELKSTGPGGVSVEDRTCPILQILPLAFFAAREGAGGPDTVDKQRDTIGAHCLALNPGTSTHYLGNLDYSTSLCLSVPICIMDTIAGT